MHFVTYWFLENYWGNVEIKQIPEAISQRVSIGKFREKDIRHVQMNTLLNAGLCAPSVANKRPFHFVVFKDKKND